MIPAPSACAPLLVLSLLLATAPAHALPFQNGSFELAQGPSGTLATGSTFITGWVVGGGTIDYLNNSPWPGTDGPHSIDLDGNSTAGPGSLRQTFDTIAGTAYQILFDLAGNPGAGPVIKTLRVSAAGVQTNYSFNTTGRSFTNMGWQLTSFSFVAAADTTTLLFQSTTGTGYGPVIDYVRVSAVPEAPTWWLWAGGLAALAGRRARR